MPISVLCDSCGHTLKAPDNSAGRRGKCPRCGEPIVVPMPGLIPEAMPITDAVRADPYFPAVDADPYPRPASKGDPGRPVLAMVSGKPANVWGGTIVPASFGKTVLWLHETRVVEKTRRPVAQRDCEILISSVDSAQIAVSGNPLLIILGFTTLGLFGLGLIFFVLYFYLKHKFLVIHSHSNALVVTIKGDEAPYREFLSATLDAAERHRIATAL